MKKSNSNAGALEALKGTLAKYISVGEEVASVEAMRVGLEASIAEKIKSGRFDDNELVASLSALKTKLTLLPAKLESLDADISDATSKLKESFGPARIALDRHADATQQEVRGRLEAFLIQYLPNQPIVTGPAVETSEPTIRVQASVDNGQLERDSIIDRIMQLIPNVARDAAGRCSWGSIRTAEDAGGLRALAEATIGALGAI
jgi:hypothetical protein